MNETTVYLMQWRANEHEPWKDDTFRYPSPQVAKTRVDKCKESKLMRSAQFRVIGRTDVVVVI